MVAYAREAFEAPGPADTYSMPRAPSDLSIRSVPYTRSQIDRDYPPSPTADQHGLGLDFAYDEPPMPSPELLALAPSPPSNRTSGFSKLLTSLPWGKKKGSQGSRLQAFPSPTIVVSPPCPSPRSSARYDLHSMSPPRPLGQPDYPSRPPLRHQQSVGATGFRLPGAGQRDRNFSQGPAYARSSQPPLSPLPPMPHSAPAHQTQFVYSPLPDPPRRPTSRPPSTFGPSAGIRSSQLPAPSHSKAAARTSSATLAYLAPSPPAEAAPRFDTIPEVSETDEEDVLKPLEWKLVTEDWTQATGSEDSDCSDSTYSIRKVARPPQRVTRSKKSPKLVPSPRLGDSFYREHRQHKPRGSITEEEDAAAADLDDEVPRKRTISARRTQPALELTPSSNAAPPKSEMRRKPSSYIHGLAGPMSPTRLPPFRFSTHGVSVDEVIAKLDKLESPVQDDIETLSPVFAQEDLSRSTTPTPVKAVDAKFAPTASPLMTSSDSSSSVASSNLSVVSPRPRVQSLMASVDLDLYLRRSTSPSSSPRPVDPIVEEETEEEQSEDDPVEVVVLPPTPEIAGAERFEPPRVEVSEPSSDNLTASTSDSSILTSETAISSRSSETSLSSLSESSLDTSCEDIIESMLQTLARPHTPQDFEDGERTPTLATFQQQQKSFSFYQESALTLVSTATLNPGVDTLVTERPIPRISIVSASSVGNVYGGADWDDSSSASESSSGIGTRSRKSVRFSAIGAARVQSVIITEGIAPQFEDAPTCESSDAFETSDFSSESESVVETQPETQERSERLIKELLRRRSAVVSGRFDDVELDFSDEEGIVQFGERVSFLNAEGVAFGMAM